VTEEAPVKARKSNNCKEFVTKFLLDQGIFLLETCNSWWQNGHCRSLAYENRALRARQFGGQAEGCQ
jgi:hypothetical protein